MVRLPAAYLCGTHRKDRRNRNDQLSRGAGNAGRGLRCGFWTSAPAHADIEALRISHPTIVEAKCLFVDVPEQMKWLNADVGAMQLPLDERPEVFHPVSANVAVRALDRVIDDLMLEAVFKYIFALNWG